MVLLKALVSAVFLVAFVGVVSATVTLKVGLYNYIPDLNNDGLQSYNAMIEDGFNSINENEQVDTIVDKLVYNPFGSTYLMMALIYWKLNSILVLRILLMMAYLYQMYLLLKVFCLLLKLPHRWMEYPLLIQL